MQVKIRIVNKDGSQLLGIGNSLEDCQKILADRHNFEGVLEYEVEKGLLKPIKYISSLSKESTNRVLTEIFLSNNN
jgi:hypothetical protein